VPDSPDDFVHAGDTASASEEETEKACPNCDATLRGRFCHDCGQRDHDGRITFGDLGRHLVDSLFDVQRGFLYTLRQVALSPGDVARRYVRGERKTFTNPLTMFILVATAVFFAIGFFKAEFVNVMAEATKLSMPDVAFEEGGSMEKVFGITSRQEYGEMTFFVVQRAYSYVGIFYCLLIAVALRLFFTRCTIAENVVFQLYTFTQINLFGILSCILTLGLLDAPNLYFASSIGGIILFQMLAGRSYWGGSLKETLLNVFGVAVGYIGFIVASLIVGAVIGIGYALLF